MRGTAHDPRFGHRSVGRPQAQRDLLAGWTVERLPDLRTIRQWRNRTAVDREQHAAGRDARFAGGRAERAEGELAVVSRLQPDAVKLQRGPVLLLQRLPLPGG